MHHKNHRHSTSNHNNPAHFKSEYPTEPVKQRERVSVLSKIRDKFREKDATPAEVAQLRLNTQREVLKTQRMKAKQARPSRFSFLGGGESSGPTGHRRIGRQQSGTGSWLLGDSGNSGPGFSMFIDQPQKPTRKAKQQRSGIEDLFT